jgi:hypothetical protein
VPGKEKQPMTAWTGDELDRIGTADELHIASLRPDGTLRNPVTIWVVRHDDDLYVRSYRGPDGAWFRGAVAGREGHIQAGGVDQDVTFAEVTNPAVNDQIDAAYRAKYHNYSRTYVDPMVTPTARSATLKLVPRE